MGGQGSIKSKFPPYPLYACIYVSLTDLLKQGRTPLGYAAVYGYLHIMKYLKEMGADIDILDKDVGGQDD